MDVSYEPAAWRELYLMIGGAAAVLTGLIFVAVSLHPTPVLADRYMRGRAESSLLALMVVLLISGAVLIPEQPVWLLGVEIGILAVAPHGSGLRGLRGLRHLRAPRQRSIVVELLVGMAAATLGFLAGVSLVIHWGGGLWLLLPGGAIALASSVWNAWRLMVEVAAAHEG